MANKSIYNAFERMWQHTTNAVNEKANESKTYTDQKVANLVNSAPEALDTLGELAVALESHKNSYNALLEVVGGKLVADNIKQGTGTKLTKSGNDVTIKTALRSDSKWSTDALTTSEFVDRLYPVVLDKSGNLSTCVPWTDTIIDTTYTFGTWLADGTAATGYVSLVDNNNIIVSSFGINSLLVAGEGLKIENGKISITYPNGDEESY